MHALLGHRDSVILILASGIAHPNPARMVDAQNARAALNAAIGREETETIWRQAWAQSRTSSLPGLTREIKEAIERDSEAIRESDPTLYTFFSNLRILLLSIVLRLVGGGIMR